MLNPDFNLGFLFLFLSVVVLIVLSLMPKMIFNEIEGKEEKSKLGEFRETRKLVMKDHMDLHTFQKKLEEAFTSNFKENLFEKLKPKFKNYEEWDEAMIGMKEFLLLNKFMKNVPMYSDKVDEIWHQMILFTKDYDDFCQHYYGYFLHHQPHVGENKVEDPIHSRFLFDLIYSLTFSNPSDAQVEKRWGKMMKHTWTKEQMNEWKKAKPEELKSKYFKVTKETESFVDELISAIKTLISMAEKKISTKDYSPKEIGNSKNSFNATDIALLNVFVFCLIDQTTLQKEITASSGSNTASTGDYSDNGGNHNDGDSSGHGDGGGGGCGSSCSSCGGCSS